MNSKVKKMVGIGLFSAIVLVLHYLFGAIQIGGTTINPVLVPVVVGAAMYGWVAGGILGLVSGIAILWLTPPSLFYGMNYAGTVITVLVKGALSGLAAGLVYRWISKYSKFWAVLVAAIVCPLVNTGIFVAGCYIFFLPAISADAGGNVFAYIMTAFVGINFLVELGINLFFAPTITRLIKLGKKN